MKPLTHWAIHYQQKMRLRGRNDADLWGELIGPDGNIRPFRYKRQARRLIIDEAGERRYLQLDHYGFERKLSPEAQAELQAEAES